MNEFYVGHKRLDCLFFRGDGQFISAKEFAFLTRRILKNTAAKEFHVKRKFLILQMLLTFGLRFSPSFKTKPQSELITFSFSKCK